MKTIVLDREFLELDIRPGPEFEEYRRLLEREVPLRLAARNEIQAACPACLHPAGPAAFVKLGMPYVECASCGTLFVSPRPSDAEISNFFRSSGAATFWREHVLAGTRAARLEKVFRPRARWVLESIDQYCRSAESGILVGYHTDLMVEELRRQDAAHLPLVVANPIADLEFAAVSDPRITVRTTELADLPSDGSTDLFLAFDLLDRCSDVEGLFKTAARMLRPAGLFLATATLASGFDVQALWDRAPIIMPPERLNLFTTVGLTRLVTRHGFELLEFSTPGVLDAEIVQRAIRAEPSAPWPRALRAILEGAGDDAISALQSYLQRFRLSSFGRIALRAPGLQKE